MDTLPPNQTLFDDVQSPDRNSPCTVTLGNQMPVDAPSSYTANVPLDCATASLAITKSGSTLFVTISTTGSIGAIMDTTVSNSILDGSVGFETKVLFGDRRMLSEVTILPRIALQSLSRSYGGPICTRMVLSLGLSRDLLRSERVIQDCVDHIVKGFTQIVSA
ncbi:hypothetical protein FOZ61_006662 [Perkinsus olseni]|uniref:Proteasome assembly chaperone 3 n=1 Tax=Perkinsus olseni TaxID=32597 RepID=A0A7J6LCE8_PEROL|nr:hypothetical protein FOZ61_006662 [Perkinsus olseni]